MTDTSTAAVTIAQMLKFNSVKHKRKQSTSASSTVRHRPAQETARSLCQQFYLEQVVCPPKMHGAVFTTEAIDIIDLNPSATTAKFSFHGTVIFLIQHLSFTGEGVDQTIVFTGESGDGSSTLIRHLPPYYTDIPPITSIIKNVSLQQLE